ncbi:RNA polymerase sigma-70 factor (ECF subfamily) [Okibacterium sp. HSC-33S16]|uniref:RNA polymerase sigma factor n=1 Tax=Okibacterium sp. HSC-33S16 TaxID=2910965 RepID=UPI00209EBEA2|nr:RNA polymerase sigma factor [Okibacterium sp. HSC-33S16]MCP2030353.1 RNA polymerase sigma-70 factor (ECF subfamily) [Okibacterium sp. HSC-33S16]
MSTHADDADDWAKSIAGDGEAFGRIFDRHRDRIARHSYRLVASPHEVDDVVAVTFAEAWRSRDRVRIVDGSVLPWLLVTATMSAQNLRRSTRRHKALLDRLPPSSATTDNTDHIDGGPASDALRQLALPDRQVIVLCVLEGLSTSEAAVALGIPVGTTKSRLSRAKQRLAHHITQQAHLSLSRPEEA